jgi:hypothetical protein
VTRSERRATENRRTLLHNVVPQIAPPCTPLAQSRWPGADHQRQHANAPSGARTHHQLQQPGRGNAAWLRCRTSRKWLALVFFNFGPPQGRPPNPGTGNPAGWAGGGPPQCTTGSTLDNSSLLASLNTLPTGGDPGAHGRARGSRLETCRGEPVGDPRGGCRCGSDNSRRFTPGCQQTRDVQEKVSRSAPTPSQLTPPGIAETRRHRQHTSWRTAPPPPPTASHGGETATRSPTTRWAHSTGDRAFSLWEHAPQRLNVASSFGA